VLSIARYLLFNYTLDNNDKKVGDMYKSTNLAIITVFAEDHTKKHRRTFSDSGRDTNLDCSESMKLSKIRKVSADDAALLTSMNNSDSLSGSSTEEETPPPSPLSIADSVQIYYPVRNSEVKMC
jgi:hypothetical protein